MNDKKFYLIYSLENGVVETVEDEQEVQFILSTYGLHEGDYKLMEFDQMILRDIARDDLEKYKEAKTEIGFSKEHLEKTIEALEEATDETEKRRYQFEKEMYEDEIKTYQQILSESHEPLGLWCKEVFIQ